MSEEPQKQFYCYSPALTHYLKTLGFTEEMNGFNMNSKSWYAVFVRDEQLCKALDSWENFKHLRRTKQNGSGKQTSEAD